MKRLLAMALAAAMMISMVACGSNADSGDGDVEGDDGNEPVVTATYKTGLGMDVEYTVADATEDKDGSVQIDTTIAVVTFDAEGTIVAVSLDVAQQKGTFDTTGAVTGDIDLRTKVEKKEDYNMKGASPIGKELYEQLSFFEEWMIGKNVNDVLGMPTGEANGHTEVPTDEDLTAGTTISVGAYLRAIEKAWKNSEETAGEPVKTGLGVVIEVSKSDATEDKDGQIQINTEVVGASFDAEGKVVAATVDVAQQSAKFDATGKVTAEPDVRTKVEKGDDYGMRGISEIGKEVGEQYEALGEWMEGKTAAEITGMPTFDRGDGNHTNVPDVEELKASVTITVGAYLEALEEAWEMAK